MGRDPGATLEYATAGFRWHRDPRGLGGAIFPGPKYLKADLILEQGSRAASAVVRCMAPVRIRFMSSSPTFLDPIVIPLIVGETVLDVACGYGRWGNLITTNFWEAGFQRPPLIDGFDAFAANVEHCAANGAYRNVWQQTMPTLVEGVVDILEQAANKRIILSTPNFPYFRDGGETMLGYNEYEAHKSYVDRKRLKRRGYRTIPAGLPNPRSVTIRALRRLGLYHRLERPLSGLLDLLPNLANSYVAYKDVDG